MRNIIRAILFTLCIGVTIHLFASPTQEEIKDILNKATALQKERTYQADTDIKPDYTMTVQQKKLPDGSIAYRIIIVSPSSVRKEDVTLKTDHGIFDIYDEVQTAVRFPERTKTYPFPDLIEYADVEMSEELFDGHECYKITVRLSKSKAVLDRVEDYLIGSKKIKDHTADAFFEKYVSPTTIYMIGKDSLFIYSENNYSTNGALKSSRVLSNVKLDLDMDDSLFIIPENYTIKLPKDIKEYANDIADARDIIVLGPHHKVKEAHSFTKYIQIVIWAIVVLVVIIALLITINLIYKRGKAIE